jgi:hypothetical protein
MACASRLPKALIPNIFTWLGQADNVFFGRCDAFLRDTSLLRQSSPVSITFQPVRTGEEKEDDIRRWRAQVISTNLPARLCGWLVGTSSGSGSGVRALSVSVDRALSDSAIACIGRTATLRHLSLVGPCQSDLAPLSRLLALTSLHLDCEDDDDEDEDDEELGLARGATMGSALVAIAGVVGSLPELRTMSFQGPCYMSAAALAPLSNLVALTDLDLYAPDSEGRLPLLPPLLSRLTISGELLRGVDPEGKAVDPCPLLVPTVLINRIGYGVMRNVQVLNGGVCCRCLSRMSMSRGQSRSPRRISPALARWQLCAA